MDLYGVHQVQSVTHPEGPPSYFNWLDMELKVVFSFVPVPFTTAMIATEMPAASRPYSIAVAPDSSFKKSRYITSISLL
jgi:hypothetical protein